VQHGLGAFAGKAMATWRSKKLQVTSSTGTWRRSSGKSTLDMADVRLVSSWSPQCARHEFALESILSQARKRMVIDAHHVFEPQSRFTATGQQTALIP
jgi:hypothetical protein